MILVPLDVLIDSSTGIGYVELRLPITEDDDLRFRATVKKQRDGTFDLECLGETVSLDPADKNAMDDSDAWQPYLELIFKKILALVRSSYGPPEASAEGT